MRPQVHAVVPIDPEPQRKRLNASIEGAQWNWTHCGDVIDTSQNSQVGTGQDVNYEIIKPNKFPKSSLVNFVKDSTSLIPSLITEKTP